MKKIGSSFEFKLQRDQDLMRAYRREVDSARHIFMPDIVRAAVNSPAARFWVSPERAAIVIAKMRKGDSIEHMRPIKQQMYREIFRRAMEISNRYPRLPLSQVAEMVVHQPAPQFYLTVGSAIVIISIARKRSRIHNHKIRR